MSRERYTTPPEVVVEEFGRLLTTLEQAIPKAPDGGLFTRLINEARAKGLNWVEALEYVASRRY